MSLLILFLSLSVCMSHVHSLDGPILEKLKGVEIKYANMFWNYNVTERLIPANQYTNSAGNTSVLSAYNYIIPLPDRLAGLTYVGHASRLRLVLERAHSGERLRVGALGGSITAGHGVGGMDASFIRHVMDWLNLALPPGSSSRPSLMNDTSKHDYLNGAVPGTVSDYTSSCVNNHLIPEADLVLVEFAINDSPISIWNLDGAVARRPFERLLRKLLRLPSKPAVVLVNMFAIAPSVNRYHHTAERDFDELAHYYGLPSVSLKAAVLPSGAIGSSPAVAPASIFNGGAMHPGRGGHVVVSELLITLFTQLLLDNELAGTPGHMPLDEVEAVATRKLPPPLCEGNFESSIDTCYIEDQLERLVVPPVVGWNWTDEGRGKWGFVSMKKGQELRLKVNTRLEGRRSVSDTSAPILVQVAFLQSYRGMSTAKVTCEEGCSCEPVVIDAFDRRLVSVTSMADIQVTQHNKCILSLVSGAPSAVSGGRSKGSNHPEGFKFKVIGLVVGEEPGASTSPFDRMRMVSLELKKKMHGIRRKLM